MTLLLPLNCQSPINWQESLETDHGREGDGCLDGHPGRGDGWSGKTVQTDSLSLKVKSLSRAMFSSGGRRERKMSDIGKGGNDDASQVP